MAAAPHEPPCARSSAITSTHAVAAIATSTCTRRATACCSGVGCVRLRDTRRPISPYRVRTPVAVTRASARPERTVVPAYTGSSACFGTGSDSPVSADSSACNSETSTIVASAGTTSPSCSHTRSSRTRSCAATVSRWPSRTTVAAGAVSSRSCSRARSARDSKSQLIVAIGASATSTTIASARWPMAR